MQKEIIKSWFSYDYYEIKYRNIWFSEQVYQIQLKIKLPIDYHINNANIIFLRLNPFPSTQPHIFLITQIQNNKKNMIYIDKCDFINK
jgi:hypothetical protein